MRIAVEAAHTAAEADIAVRHTAAAHTPVEGEAAEPHTEVAAVAVSSEVAVAQLQPGPPLPLRGRRNRDNLFSREERRARIAGISS